jgi:predicted phage replisome organizer
MSEIHWVKLSTEMFDDRKIKQIRKLPSGNEICLIWIELITIAGKTNDNGCIYLTEDIPYNEEMLATEMGHDLQIVKLALGTFQRLHMIEILDNARIALLNWSKHQNIEGMERVRMLTRERTRRTREKQKLLGCDPVGSVTCSATVAVCNAIDSDSDSEVEVEKKEKKAERAPLVLLTDSELDKLEKEYGPKNTQAAIKKLSAFKLSKGKRYKSDYGAILSWAMRSVLEKGAVPEPTTGSKREVEVVDEQYYQDTGKIRMTRAVR